MKKNFLQYLLSNDSKYLEAHELITLNKNYVRFIYINIIIGLGYYLILNYINLYTNFYLATSIIDYLSLSGLVACIITYRLTSKQIVPNIYNHPIFLISVIFTPLIFINILFSFVKINPITQNLIVGGFYVLFIIIYYYLLNKTFQKKA